jgi:predicted aldo/keto reductase-like oxidoreductase
MKESITRRDFLRKTTAGMAALPVLSVSGLGPGSPLAQEAKNSIPKRELGKTGVRVSQLAFGGGSRFVQYKTDAEAIRVLNWAIDHGVTYVDTAHSYGDGLSETRYGMVMKDRRKEVFLVTKVEAREPDEFQREFELSLKRLQVNYVDLLHIHGLGKMDDVDRIGKTGGVYEVLTRLKSQKMARFIGFTSHTDGAAAQTAIERFDFDCCMMQLNPAKVGNFEDLALPAARKKNMGIVAMKAAAQEKILGRGPGKANIDELLRYALSLPVAAVNIGMPTFEMVEHNVRLAGTFTPMTPTEIRDLQQRLASAKESLEAYFRNHSDILAA